MKKILNTIIAIGILCALLLMMRREMSILNSKILHLNGKQAPATEAVHASPASSTHFIR
jgi:hypothetical protein